MGAARLLYPFRTYVPSGAPGRAGLLPLAGLLSAAVTSFAYGWLLALTPCMGYGGMLLLAWLVVRVVLAFAFAYSLAVCVSLAGHLLRVRNAAILRWHAALTALVAIWLAWVIYLWALQRTLDPAQQDTLLDWLQSPAAVWLNVQALAQGGMHTVGLQGLEMPAGFVLYAAWGVEILIIVVVCVAAAPRRLRARAFCESCNRWMAVEPPLRFISAVPARDVRRHGLQVLGEVGYPPPEMRFWTRIGRQRCRRCSAAVFRVDQVLSVEQHGLARAAAMHDWLLRVLLAPLSGTRMVEEAESLLPLVWQDETERTVLERLDRELAADPRSQLRR